MSAYGAGGNLVVLGDTGIALGDSLYEKARLFVRGATVKASAPTCVLWSL